MKKLSIVLLLFGLILAACGTSEPQDEQDPDQDVTEETPEERADDGANEETETDDADENEAAENDADETEPTEQEVDYPEAGDAEFQDVVNLAYDSFIAQGEEDYDFLTSILSEGSALDENTNVFTFENVTYPHDMEFVQADLENIDFRYTHEEEDGSVIVGFGVIDYETESSYTIDYQFVKEDGEWKMNDMDKNA